MSGYTLFLPMFDKEKKETNEVELYWRNMEELEYFVEMVTRFKKLMKDRDLEEIKKRFIVH